VLVYLLPKGEKIQITPAAPQKGPNTKDVMIQGDTSWDAIFNDN
jgi:hypothetical protein